MNPDIQSHELADMRIAADKAPFDLRVKFHSLLDVFEDSEERDEKLSDAEGNVTALEETIEVVTKILRRVAPEAPAKFRNNTKVTEYGEFVSEETWQEKLAEFDPPEDTEDGQPWEPPSAYELAELKAKRDALIATELNRARAAEEKLRARVEALKGAVESALEELE